MGNHLVRYITENQDETLFEAGLKAYLVLLVEGRSSQVFLLRGTVYLGRDKTNSVVVADQKVSRHHTMLTAVDDAFIITDQGSANGTYLNGVLISQPVRLKPMDKITIGDTVFLFTTNPQEAEAAFSGRQPMWGGPSAPLVLPDMGGVKPVWLAVGCMGLVIMGLLLMLAVFDGVLVGETAGRTIALPTELTAARLFVG